MSDTPDSRLHASAPAFAEVALANIEREFPAGVIHEMQGPDDWPRPRTRNPAFFGSYDWHSCVEMHWLLVRLLRTVPDAVPQSAIRAALDRSFRPEALNVEAAFFRDLGNAAKQRPYGWGWGLTLVHEVATWGDPDARRWSEALAPLAESLTQCYLDWLPKATYPVRHGVHLNSAWGLARALPYARSLADRRLADALTGAARRWFASDEDYPGRFEPSGSDFLSPALAEAELMSLLLCGHDFAEWFTRFLPGVEEGQPKELFTPAHVSDASDGQIAHLHGLNLSRAYCWQRIAASLPEDDARRPVIDQAVRSHADAALPHVVGDHYMVEHWLAAYAVLLFAGTAGPGTA
ncbi:MAG TPA: DUF2891 domain-containing protein [Actinopolymorphaceae bacterium]